jgi:hypothetical protein
MKMEFFTEKGVKQVKEEYKNLIGKEFYFDKSKTKFKLSYIEKEEIKCPNGFEILFHSDPEVFMLIYEFMKLNKIKYHIHDFETISIEL